MKKGYFLTRSLFVWGIQCHKSLWLHRYHPELASLPDEGLMARLEEGVAVGRVAHQLFPGGRDIRLEASTLPHRLWLTQKLMALGVPTLYDAAFSFDGVSVFPDILQYGRHGWALYDVKS